MYTLKQLVTDSQETMMEIDGKWVPARGENYKYRSLSQRFKEAWMVFTGKADAFTWPEGQ